MPKFKRGYAIGIRTWWTMASEEVWIKTHKLAQFTVTISGVIMLCIPFVVNNLTLFYLCWILSLLVGMIIPLLYSVYLYNQGKNNGKDYFQNKN